MDPILKGFVSRYGDFTVNELAPLIIQFIKNGWITRELLDEEMEIVKNQKKIEQSIFEFLFNDNYNTYGKMKELFKEIFDMRNENLGFVYDNSYVTSLLRKAEPGQDDTNYKRTIKANQTTILNEYLAEKRPALLLIEKYKAKKENDIFEELELKKMELCDKLRYLMESVTGDYAYLPKNIEKLKNKFKDFYEENPIYYEQLSPSHIMGLFGFDMSYVENEELKKELAQSIKKMTSELSKDFNIVTAKKITLKTFRVYKNEVCFNVVLNRIIKNEKLKNYSVDCVKNIIRKYYDKDLNLIENYKTSFRRRYKTIRKK